MLPDSDDTPTRRWGSPGFLADLNREGNQAASAAPTPLQADTFGRVGGLEYGSDSLALVVHDADLHERLSVLRSSSFDEADLIAFAVESGSVWALDALVGRYTDHGHDWSSFRSAVVCQAGAEGYSESPADRMSIDQLAGLVEVLGARGMDPDCERALLRLIVRRQDALGAVDQSRLRRLTEQALRQGEPEAAARMLKGLDDNGWHRRTLDAELRHPRFGGMIHELLDVLNEPYRRLGLEPLDLLPGTDGSFDGLYGAAEAGSGLDALVTVLLVTHRPNQTAMTAARSVVQQTHNRWELHVIDDGSPREFTSVLDDIEALDPRIRVTRHEERAGELARKLEGIAGADGDYITIQNSHEWSHPRRLEIQLRDLESRGSSVANVVFALPVSPTFSLLSGHGVGLRTPASSLLWRRTALQLHVENTPVQEAGSADDTIRRSIESSTRQRVAEVVPAIPLLLVSDRSGGYADSAEVAEASRSFDVVVILDGRSATSLREFHAAVAEEMRAATTAGLRVAMVQSRSAVNAQAEAMLSHELHRLVSDGTVGIVRSDDSVQARTVVVRHASAAQGQVAKPSNVSADQVFVVEDSVGGDRRGVTVAAPDVVATVRVWFGVEPRWIVAPPRLSDPVVDRVHMSESGLTLWISTPEADAVESVHLISAGDRVESVLAGEGSGALVCTVEHGAFASGEWAVEVDFRAADGLVTKRGSITPRTSAWNESGFVVIRTEAGGLHLLNAEAGPQEMMTASEFAQSYASAVLTSARVVGTRLQTLVTQRSASSILSVYALRRVNGELRRRDFTATTTQDGRRVWTRPTTKFANSRWSIYATFRTPLGLADLPIEIAPGVEIEGTQQWWPYIVGSDVLVAAPRQSLAKRIGRRARSEIDRRVTPRLRRANGRKPHPSRLESASVHFAAVHADARSSRVPALSIVMPVYNVEPYLAQAIASVLTQDFADFELIIVDDASTDGSRAVALEYWQQDPRVRLFELGHNSIGGAGVPSNVGIRASRGKYVGFVDSDDYVAPGGFSALVQLAEANGAELVIGDFRTFTEMDDAGSPSYDRNVWDELPIGSSTSAGENPALFRLSPVPWRKLYRRDFLADNGILYPEGDYFYEDNPLHWFVLSRARSVVMCDEVISFHRMEREGQTMGAQTYKLGAFVSHANSVLNFLLAHRGIDDDAIFGAFLDYVSRSAWTATRQSQPAAAALIRHGFNDIFQRAMAAVPTARVSAESASRLGSFGGAYGDFDLTIVIPVFNSSDLLSRTLDSVLALNGVRFDVLLVDDGSTDDSLAIMQEYERRHSNIHVFTQGNRGAGRARNSVIPLCSGRYTYFLDADDVIDAEALADAVKYADARGSDLVFVQYAIEHVDEGRIQKMLNADRVIWDQLPTATGNAELQGLVSGLVNYPWNRIIRTTLLHNANIFFGPTAVHNDVLFHWHSIVSAQHIGFLETQVCVHRKFATRAQVTNISDARRLVVLEALRGTYERISPLDGYANVRPEWESFVAHLVEWARDRVPQHLRDDYAEKSSELVASLETTQAVDAR